MPISNELKKILDNKVRILLNSFKREFKKVKLRKEFNDNRKILFLNRKKYPKNTFFFGKEEKEEINKPQSIKEFAACIYKKDEILIYINYSEIYKGVFFHSTAKDFLKNIQFWEKVFKQIAHHEYGHSFLTQTEFDAYPLEVRTFLQSIEYNSIDQVSNDNLENLKEAFRKSKYGLTSNLLNNIELSLVEQSFREYHAKNSVKIRIDDTLPIESLKVKLWEFKHGLKEKNKWKEDYLQKKDEKIKTLSSRFFYLLILTQDFHIFDSWENLKSLFEENELTKMLEIFRLINTIIKKTIEKNNNLDEMRLDIYELAILLDKFDYEKIFFENVIEEKDFIILKKINGKLNEKKER